MGRQFLTVLLLSVFLFPLIAAPQSSSPKKDIPTIAKSAKEAIVTIVTANNDEPIALGSGFLVSSDGAIATNYHVIASGNVAVVKFADGTVLPVDGILAIDKVHDLAIVKIHGKTFQTLTLGNSDQIQVGEEVVAIGNPLGLELTVSNGILSGVRITEDEGKFLQTTAPISHGSSGGPLFNMFGEVVGVNTLYLEGGESLNFATPVNEVKNLMTNQSAQLLPLPNEREAKTEKPEPSQSEPSTGAASDTASAREGETVVAPSSGKTANNKQLPAYYVRAYQHGAYIIEHGGRQLAATCREDLSWLDGTRKPGRPTGYECLYIKGKVGKNIPAVLMWRGDKELRYEPLAEIGSEVQIADILDIIAEGPIGSPLRRPSPRTSPEILKNLHWIQNTLADDEGTIFRDDYSVGWSLPDVNGCQVTLVYDVKRSERSRFSDSPFDHVRWQVNLGDLDPSSIQVGNDTLDFDIAPVSMVTVLTTDSVPTIRYTQGDRYWQVGFDLMARYPVTGGSFSYTRTELDWELHTAYAARFAKALKQTITLCGGKTSSF